MDCGHMFMVGLAVVLGIFSLVAIIGAVMHRDGWGIADRLASAAFVGSLILANYPPPFLQGSAGPGLCRFRLDAGLRSRVALAASEASG